VRFVAKFQPTLDTTVRNERTFLFFSFVSFEDFYKVAWLMTKFLEEMSQQCPCGLWYEDVRDLKFFGPGALCTAFYADESVDDHGTPKICNRPLGIHPKNPAVQQASQRGISSL
jgi:hypothetical protein